MRVWKIFIRREFMKIPRLLEKICLMQFTNFLNVVNYFFYSDAERHTNALYEIRHTNALYEIIAKQINAAVYVSSNFLFFWGASFFDKNLSNLWMFSFTNIFMRKPISKITPEFPTKFFDCFGIFYSHALILY